MALNTATELVDTLIAYALIIFVVYISYLGVTGPDGEFDVWVALALLAMAYSLLHGRDALVGFIRAWRGKATPSREEDDEEG